MSSASDARDREARKMAAMANELAQILATEEGKRALAAAAEQTRRRCAELREAAKVDPRVLQRRTTI